MLLPTLVSGLTLLSCDLPDHVSGNQHWNGAPFGFQCCILVNKGRILSQMIGQYQKPKSTIANSTGLSKVVLSELPSVAQICSLKYTFVCSYQLTNIYPVGSLTRQYTGPGWQLNSPTECLTIVKARALCHPLAKSRYSAFQTTLVAASATSSCT